MTKPGRRGPDPRPRDARRGAPIDTLLTQSAIFTGSLVVLALVADWMVSAVLVIAVRFRIPGSIAGATLAAVATSAPELGTNVFSLLASRSAENVEATASIGAGTIFGSAVFNLAAVVGLVGVFHQVKLAHRVLWRDMVVYLAALVLTLVLIGVGGGSRVVTRMEGWLLVMAYGAYLVWLLRDARDSDEPAPAQDLPVAGAVARLVLSVGAISAASYLLVGATQFLAQAGARTLVLDEEGLLAGLSLVVVAGATSVPDLFASLAAARRGKGSLAVSNALGSNTFDLLICIGLPFGVLGGQRISGNVVLSGGFLLGLSVMVLVIGGELTRARGAILVAIYVLFVGLVVLVSFGSGGSGR